MRNRVTLSVLLVAIACIPAAPAAAADAPPLRWKLRAGEALRYELTEHVTYALVPKQPPIEMTLRFDVALVVRDVAEDGTARVALILERVRLGGRGGAAGRMRSIDTANAPPGRRAVDPVLIGRPVTFRLTPRGEVRDVSVAEAKLSPEGERAMGEVRKDPIGAGMLPSFATLYLAPEEALKTLLAAIVFPLPDGPLGGTQPWEHERLDYNEVFDIQSARVKYEPAGASGPAGARADDAPPDAPPGTAPDEMPPDEMPPDLIAPGEAVVRMTGVIRQGARGGDTPPLSRGTLAGTLRFDPAAGRLTGGRWERRLVFGAPGQTDREVKITHTTRSILKLMPPRPPPE